MGFVKLKKDEYQKVTLQLSNGAVLKSKFALSKGKMWREYHLVHKDQPKFQMPLVSGFSSGSNMHVACLDFDELPPGFTSFEQIIDTLLDLPGMMACKSPSGRAKAFCVFKWGNHHPDNQTVIARLNELLPTSLQNRFDPKGISRFFLSTEVADCLSSLSSSSFFDWSGEQDSNIVSGSYSPVNSYTFSYHLADESLIPTSIEPFINRGKHGWQSRLKFTRILVAMFGLSNKTGYSLPVKSLAEQCDASTATVSAWLGWFKTQGLLQCESNSYIVGLTAKRYTARGELLKAIQARKDNINYSITLPKQLPKDGEFYRYFLSLSKRVPKWEDFKIIIASIPGIEYKNRMGMAKRIHLHDRKKEQRV